MEVEPLNVLTHHRTAASCFDRHLDHDIMTSMHCGVQTGSGTTNDAVGMRNVNMAPHATAATHCGPLIVWTNVY